jgi:hypothetical protein
VLDAEDDTQLRALLLRTVGGRSSSVVSGRALRGTTQSPIELLPPELASAGAELQLEAFVADAAGNVTRVTAGR